VSCCVDSMQVYLKLQFAILNRKLKDFGVHPIVAYPTILFLIILGGNELYSKTNFTNYIVLIVALSLASKLSEQKRNDFLKSVFSKNKYTQLRIVENIVFCFPFSLFLVYKKQFLFLLILNLLLFTIAQLKFSKSLNFTIPTPFGKKPFEFVVGFRNTFYIFPFAYFLTYISISVNNFNLGIFSLLLIGVTCLSYYSKVEQKYMVWIFSLSPVVFLFEKTKICLTYFTTLSLPVIVSIGTCFFSEVDTLLISFLLCCVYLTSIVFAKYAAFPNQISIQQGTLIALSMMFPYTILIIIPILYVQAINKLKSILND